MKKLKITLTLLLAFLMFNSCSVDEDVLVSPTESELQSRIPDPGLDGDEVDEEEQEEVDQVQNSPLERGLVLTFGRYYGKCQGNACVEIFKLFDLTLLEDTLDNNPQSGSSYQGKFVNFNGSESVKIYDLVSDFPSELLNSKLTTYGAPNATDNGGIYLEYKQGLVHRYWFIDLNTQKIPKYLVDYVTLVNNRVTEIGRINKQN